MILSTQTDVLKINYEYKEAGFDVFHLNKNSLEITSNLGEKKYALITRVKLKLLLH